MSCGTIKIETTSADEVLEVGIIGPQGPSGAAGVGVPSGGISGYVLAKASNTDYDTEWIFNSGGGGGDLSNPPPIGDVTPNTGAFTNLSAVTGSFTTVSAGTVSAGQLTAITGFFTTISASGLATLPNIHGSLAGDIYIHVKNTHGSALSRGTPVYVKGNVGDTDRVEVGAADFDDPTKMPAIGLLDQDLDQNATGEAVILGELPNANTAAYALNTELYVGNAGTLTATRPTTGQVQSVGVVSRVQSGTGVIVVNMQGTRSPNETFAAATHAASHLPEGADELFDQSLNTTDNVTFGTIYATGELIASSIKATSQIQIEDNNSYVATLAVGQDNLTDSRNYQLPNASGTIALTSDFAAPPAIGSTTPAAGTFTTLTANNGTITASAPVLTLAQTWNASGTIFTGLNLALTNTASASGSSYFNINLDGVEALSIRRGESTANATLIRCGGSGLRWTARTRTGGGVGLNFEHTLGIGSSLEFLATASGTTAGDVFLLRDGASDTLAQRRSTNAQTFRIYNTYTDATNFERLRLAWASNSAILGTEKGSGGGTARDLVFQTDGTTRVTIGATSGSVVCSAGLSVVSSLTFQGNSSIVGNIASGVLRLLNAAQSGFDRLQFGGSTTSFPALKRDSTALQARLANDSDFCPLQGQLRIHQNAVAETPTATHTMTLFDATGTAYKVLCVAA